MVKYKNTIKCLLVTIKIEKNKLKKIYKKLFHSPNPPIKTLLYILINIRIKNYLFNCYF